MLYGPGYTRISEDRAQARIHADRNGGTRTVEGEQCKGRMRADGYSWYRMTSRGRGLMRVGADGAGWSGYVQMNQDTRR